MINVENVSKSYGAQTLFSGITFRLNQRERLGVVGRNGHGKTTLFRIIAGEEAPDGGSVGTPKNYRIGYVRQHLDFTEQTLLQEGMRGLPPHERDHHWKVEKLLAGLGFTDADMVRSPGEFSGGYQVRLNLVKILASEPDLLLLDEPTNYLDITSIRWMVRFLNAWPHELMLITHDRGFMDKVVTHTLAIHRKRVRKIAGDTGKLYTQIAQEEEIHEKTRINDERRRREIEQFITRFRAKARLANLVQSRIKTLEKMEKKEKLSAAKSLDFSFRSKPFPGKQVLTASRVSFAYDGGPPLIRDFSLTVSPGERIGVVGKNGRGKTTLLKLLAGGAVPREGEIVYSPNAAVGVFEQTNVRNLVADRTVEEEIRLSHPDVDRQKARNICGAMMFEGDGALKKIGVLSGGEKSRVMLGKLLVTPVNVLLLDEPTNHLDMDAGDALLSAIDDFDGVVIIVTHNEMFLHALAQRLVVFQGDGIRVFDGTYADFLEKVGWEEETGEKPASPPPRAEHETPRMSRKDLRRRRSEILAERAKVLKPLERRIAEAENAIDAREKELEELNTAMQEATLDGDGSKVPEISQALHARQDAIDRLFDELEQATREYEALDVRFQKQLGRLDEAQA